MLVEVHTLFHQRLVNTFVVPLRKGELAPGKDRVAYTEQKVQTTGTALFDLRYGPSAGDYVLVDGNGRPISGQETTDNPQAFDSFHATSRMELATLAGLYLAAIAAFLAAIGIVVNALLR